MKLSRVPAGVYLALAAGSAVFHSPAKGQSERDYIMRSGPYPAFYNPEPTRYNLKYRNITARISASAQVEYNDNLTLSENNKESDISFGPDVSIGFLWPITKANVLQLDFGFGYRWYLDHPSISTVLVAPNTRFDYRIFLEEVQINIHEILVIQNDPTGRADISGGSSGGDLLSFKRMNNTAGFLAEWRPVREVGLNVGYDFIFDKSLGSTFELLDRTTHTLRAGVSYDFSPRWSVALSSYYAITDYDLEIQNDGISYGVGPILTYKPTQFLSIVLGVGYGVSKFDKPVTAGHIADTSEFGGFTASLEVRHTINSSMSHYLRVVRDRELGLGSNFNEMFSVQYGTSKRLTSAIALRVTGVYEHLLASGGGEEADRYLLYLGTDYRLTRQWAIGLAYALSLKDSVFFGRDYTQNRLTLDVTRHF